MEWEQLGYLDKYIIININLIIHKNNIFYNLILTRLLSLARREI